VQENVQDVPWPQDLFRVDPRCSDPEQLREVGRDIGLLRSGPSEGEKIVEPHAAVARLG
jgi:hypothetical protein